MRAISIATLMFVSLIFVGIASPCKAQSKEDRSAIQAIVDSESDAWNRGDANAFGAHYAEDGSFTNVIGQQLYGRKAFIEQHARIFSTIYKGSHNTFSVGTIKFVRPDVAVVDIDGVLRNAAQLPPGLKASGVRRWIASRQASGGYDKGKRCLDDSRFSQRSGLSSTSAELISGTITDSDS